MKLQHIYHNKIFRTFFHAKFTKIFLSSGRRSCTLFCYETKIILGPSLEIKKLNNVLSPSALDTGTRPYLRRSFL